MIPANELRINNLVLFDDKVDVIYSIGETMASGQNHSYFHYKRLSPIPLTPEVLKKCGFKKDTTYPDWMKLHIGNSTVINANDGNAWVEKIANDEEYSVGLGGANYLHQLQNLYFALAGEELTVNL